MPPDQLLTELPQALFSMGVAGWLLTSLARRLDALTEAVNKMCLLMQQHMALPAAAPRRPVE